MANRFDYTGKKGGNFNKKPKRAPLASTARRKRKQDANLKMAMKNAEGGNNYTWQKLRAGASRRMKPKAKPKR